MSSRQVTWRIQLKLQLWVKRKSPLSFHVGLPASFDSFDSTLRQSTLTLRRSLLNLTLRRLMIGELGSRYVFFCFYDIFYRVDRSMFIA